jgi:hypothetical protein
VFAGLNLSNVIARLPHYMQTRELRQRLSDVVAAIGDELDQVEKLAEERGGPGAYRTVDKNGDIRDIVPGRSPRPAGLGSGAESAITRGGDVRATMMAPPVPPSPHAKPRRDPPNPAGAR